MDTLKREYLMRIKELKITPNFFMSETYFQQPALIGKEKDGWLWIEEDGVILFPAIPRDGCQALCPVTGFWASTPDTVIRKGFRFLDYQFIYDPKGFVSMKGGKWETFRKNSRKFIKRYPNLEYVSHRDECQVRNLLADWLEQRKEDFYDAEFLINCILHPRPTDYIKYLYRGQELIAINYADENYMYINYRFLICKNEPFADEHARLCFYLDNTIQMKNKLVNDGGCLDSEGLKRFKEKLNPIEITKIYSYEN